MTVSWQAASVPPSVEEIRATVARAKAGMTIGQGLRDRCGQGAGGGHLTPIGLPHLLNSV